jgi:pimeloyl-ACP methyl ester carboxylesterase
MRRWIRRAFLVWAVVAHVWLINSVRTQGVSEELLQSTQRVGVIEEPTGLEFRPAHANGRSALIFICGSGVHAHAYAPLLRPVADEGYRVFIVKLPYRFAPLAAHKDEVVARTLQLMASHREVSRWVVAGHSLGGALAARVAQSTRGRDVSFVLIGTTHPRDHDLSKLDAPITKVYATNDGVAPVDGVMANRKLLPDTTAWVEIKGGNHSQFGHYGHQLFDGRATITRAAQQAVTRQVMLDELRKKRNHLTNKSRKI